MIGGVLCDRCWRRAVDLVENTPAGFKTLEAYLILETNPNVLVLALFNAATFDRQEAIYRRLQEVVIGAF